MSDANLPNVPPEEAPPPARGPNLTLVYSLILLAMIVAIVIAAMIVLPFYTRR